MAGDIYPSPPFPRFHVNLLCGEEEGAEAALHFNPRMDESTVVFNTKERGGWGQEERGRGLPFQRGQPFEVLLIATEEGFKVCPCRGVAPGPTSLLRVGQARKAVALGAAKAGQSWQPSLSLSLRGASSRRQRDRVCGAGQSEPDGGGRRGRAGSPALSLRLRLRPAGRGGRRGAPPLPLPHPAGARAAAGGGRRPGAAVGEGLLSRPGPEAIKSEPAGRPHRVSASPSGRAGGAAPRGGASGRRAAPGCGRLAGLPGTEESHAPGP